MLVVLSLGAARGSLERPGEQRTAQPATAVPGESRCIRAFFADRTSEADIERIAAESGRADPHALMLVLSSKDAMNCSLADRRTW